MGTERQTDRQRDRHTRKLRDRHTDRHTDRETQRNRRRQRHTHRDRDRGTDRQRETETDRQRETQTDRQTETDRQTTNRQSNSVQYTSEQTLEKCGLSAGQNTGTVPAEKVASSPRGHTNRPDGDSAGQREPWLRAVYYWHGQLGGHQTSLPGCSRPSNYLPSFFSLFVSFLGKKVYENWPEGTQRNRWL